MKLYIQYIIIFLFIYTVPLESRNVQWEPCENFPKLGYPLITFLNNKLILSTNNGVYHSTNEGNTWERISDGFEGTHVVVKDSLIFICTSDGVYRSDDEGYKWEKLSNGLPAGQVYDIEIDNCIIYICHRFDIFRSEDNGDSWDTVSSFEHQWDVSAIGIQDSLIYLGFYGGNILVSKDYGENWNDMDTTLITVSSYIAGIEILDENIYIAITQYPVFVSSNMGKDWKVLQKGYSNKLKKINNNIFLSFDSHCWYNYYSYHFSHNGHFPLNLFDGIRFFREFTESDMYLYGIAKDTLFRYSKCVLKEPLLEFSGDTLVCPEDSSIFKTGKNCHEYVSWYLNDKRIKTEDDTTLSLVFHEIGKNKLTLIKENDYILFVDSVVKYINVIDNPEKPIITMSNDTLYSSSDYGNQWYHEDTLIANAVGQWHYPLYTGNYTVRIGEDKCISDMSEVYFVEYVSVEETTTTDNISISPNPATVYIEINNVMLSEAYTKYSEAHHPVVNVKVFDVLGNVVIALGDSRFRGKDMNDSEGEKVRLDISALAPGVYFVKIGDKVSKFVKM